MLEMLGPHSPAPPHQSTQWSPILCKSGLCETEYLATCSGDPHRGTLCPAFRHHGSSSCEGGLRGPPAHRQSNKKTKAGAAPAELAQSVTEALPVAVGASACRVGR